MIDTKRLAVLTGLFLVALAFWNTQVLYPVRALVVMFHEVSHGLAAIATGGEIVRIELGSNLGGVCWSRGGSMLAVLPAGYLGSMIWGAVILIIAARTRADQVLSVLLGGFLISITLGYVRTPFGLVTGFAWGGALLWLGLKANESYNELVLEFLGLTSMLFAVLDIKEDLIDRTVAISDAAVFSKVLGGPPVFWGVVWISLALVASAFALKVALSGGPAAGGPARPVGLEP